MYCDITNVFLMIVIILIGNWHPEVAKKVYREFRLKLLESLPMLDAVFLELLKHQNLFPGDLKEQVLARDTRMGKAVWFLDNAIEHPLNIDNFNPLCKLLTAMADEMYLKNDFLKQLATKIEQELDKETSFITTKEVSEGCYIYKDISALNSDSYLYHLLHTIKSGF